MCCRPLRSISLIGVLVAGCADQGGPDGERPIEGGTFEPSGVAAVADDRGALFVDDDDPAHVLWLEFDADGTARPAVAIRTGATVIDPEGMTTDGRFVYVVGSQSKGLGLDRDSLVRFTFDPARHEILDLSVVRNLRTLLAAEVSELREVDRSFADHTLNIEAIAWDPRGRRLLLGLRAPLADNHALVVPLALRDPAGAFDTGNLHVPGGRAIRLPLGGAGIRSLEYDYAAAAFSLITGSHVNEERLAFRLLTWDPDRQNSLRERRVFPAGLKPEGITRVSVGGVDRTLVVYDSGRFRVLD